MKNLIKIGLPSKGRLKEGSINFFASNNLKPNLNGGERNYFAQIDNLPNGQVIYLHAKIKVITYLPYDSCPIYRIYS